MAVVASDVLRRPSPCDHLIQAYTDDGFLASVVADYVGTGFELGEAAVIIVTRPHVTLFSDRLTALGVDVPRAVAARQLLFLDAQQTMGLFLVDGQPDRTRFLAVVATAHDWVRSAGYRGVRLYGEMVDLLWGHNLEATIALERLWNAVLADERLSLFCAYRLDPLDRHVQGVLRQVTHCHSHSLPVENPERFDRAVDRAYAEVFGVRGDARMLRDLMIERQALTTRMPEAQAALFALEKMPPPIANEVRATAQRHYRSAA
jgi:MEDS: MEthanogen/methylotroph, DcmR Sensory domain